MPKAQRDKIASLRRQGWTIDEILIQLKRDGFTVSRSALGVYTKELDDQSVGLPSPPTGIGRSDAAGIGDRLIQALRLEVDERLAADLARRVERAAAIAERHGLPLDVFEELKAAFLGIS